MSSVTALSALLSLALTASPSPEGREPQTLDVHGEFVHPTAGVRFPENVGGFVRTAITQFDDQGRDLAASYELGGSPDPFWATFYVYAADSGTNDLREKFAGARRAVLEHEGVRLTLEEDISLAHGLYGRWGAFSVEQQSPRGKILLDSYLVLCRWREWWVKWRITFSATDKQGRLESALRLIEALTHRETPRKGYREVSIRLQAC